jgi:hypothetical protein
MRVMLGVLLIEGRPVSSQLPTNWRQMFEDGGLALDGNGI